MIGQRSEYASLMQLMFSRQIPGFDLYIVNVKKYIRMGITIFQFVIWGGISSYIRSETMFNGSAVKQNFRPYIRRYTSSNDKLEYSYPLIAGRGKAVFLL